MDVTRIHGRLLQLSVGLERGDGLIADLAQALEDESYEQFF